MKNRITKTFIAQFLPENPVIVEAGAHKGRDTIEMSNLWPKGQIHAFEPTEIYSQLTQNTKAYPNIRTYNIALDASTSQKAMFTCLGKYSRLSSLYRPSDYFTKNPKFVFNETMVNTISLDEWALRYKISRIDLLWLDAQGAESTILKGALCSLQNIKLIFLEANLVERYENIALYDELKNWLLEHNFAELAVDEEILNNRFNVLFIKKA